MIHSQRESANLVMEIEELHSHRLNDWECRFIDSLSALVGEDIPLSLKQRETLGNIWDKLS